MDWKPMYAVAAVIGAASVLVGLSFIIRTAVFRRRRRAAVEAAKNLARGHLHAITAAIVSKKADALAKVPVHADEICRLAQENGFDLLDVRASKQRLAHWRRQAKDMLNGQDKTPSWRTLASVIGTPFTPVNPDEPGTPGIEINDVLALPARTSSDGETVVTPPPVVVGTDIHPIERMIEEALALPVTRVIEVVTVDAEGAAHSSFEIDDENEIVIEIEHDIDDIIAACDEMEKHLPILEAEPQKSLDEQVDEMFDRAIEK